MVNLLLLCNLNSTSSTSLSWLPSDIRQIQVFYITPRLRFWFIVVSSVLQLFSFQDRSSPIPPTPTKFHHHLSAWIHSTPVTPGPRPFPPHSGDATCHGFHPKYPLKVCQNECGMTCCPAQLQQPSLSFFNLLFLAWTCWTHALHSWFTWLLFQEGENRLKFQPNFEAHEPLIPLSTLQGLGPFVSQTNQSPHTNLPYIDPNPTTKDHVHTIPANKFHRAKLKPNSSIHTASQKRPTDDVSSQDESQEAPTGPMTHLPYTQPHVHFNKFPHK